MYTVYILRDAHGKLYKGMTNNMKRRLAEHKSGHTVTTSRMENVEIIYFERYAQFEEARKRELYFKTASGRRWFKNILKQ